MWAILLNVVVIALGALLGGVLKQKVSDRYKDVMFVALGLVTVAVGLSTAIQWMPKSDSSVLFIVSLVVGGLLGTWWDLEGKAHRYSERNQSSKFVHGLVASCLIYCIGSLTFLGPINSVLYGDNTYLIMCAPINCVTAIVVATSYGKKMAVGSLVVLVWYSTLYLIAWLSRSAISDSLVAELNIVGGILLFTSGLSLLGIKDCKTLNLLPAMFVPILYFVLKSVVGF